MCCWHGAGWVSPRSLPSPDAIRVVHVSPPIFSSSLVRASIVLCQACTSLGNGPRLVRSVSVQPLPVSGIQGSRHRSLCTLLLCSTVRRRGWCHWAIDSHHRWMLFPTGRTDNSCLPYIIQLKDSAGSGELPAELRPPSLGVSFHLVSRHFLSVISTDAARVRQTS